MTSVTRKIERRLSIVGYWVTMPHTESIQRRNIQNILTRDFLLGFLALFTFLASYHSLIPTLPIYLAELGSNEREIGVLIGVVGVASLVSRLLVGGALLRYSEKSVMMVGALLSAFSFLSYALFSPFWPFFIARFLQGIAFACIDTAVLALVVNVTPQKYRGQAIGYVLLASSLSMAIAASLGVFLGNQYGFAVLFLSCAGLSLCCFLLSYMVRGQKVDGPDKTVSAHSPRLLNLNIIVPAMVTFLNYFVGAALFAFIPLYGVKCGVKNPGFFFSAIAIMLFTGRTLGGRILIAYDKEKIISTFLFLMVVALVILSFSRSLPMFVFVGLLWGTGLAFVVPAAMAYALEYAGSSGGTALGTHQSFMDLGMALGPVIMGLLVPLTGYRAMFLCLALICLANIGYFHFYVRRKK
jgi:predicted MFS family arabinose efflux permease